MRAFALATALVLVVSVPLASALLPPDVPGSLPYSLGPLAATNVLVNSDFENGLNGWSIYIGSGTPQPNVVVGGCDGTGHAAYIPNVVATSSVLLQRFAPVTPHVLALSFCAKVVVQRNTNGGQGIALFHNFNQFGSHFLGGVGLTGTTPQFAWGFFGAGAAADYPLDGAWHHYSVLLFPDLGLTVGSIDDVPVGYALGAPDTTSINSFYMGDGWGGDAQSGKGPASDMEWDQVYLEPLA